MNSSGVCDESEHRDYRQGPNDVSALPAVRLSSKAFVCLHTSPSVSAMKVNIEITDRDRVKKKKSKPFGERDAFIDRFIR